MIPPVVSRQWLAEHRDGVVLADVRREVPGLPASLAFEQAHLPGAVFVDLERRLAGPPSAEHGRHPLPSPEQFAAGMGRCGISDDDTVVAYDDADGVVAARLVWMLRVTGHDAALLDGSLRPGETGLERGPARPGAASFRPIDWPLDLLADREDATDAGNVVLDARPRGRYTGTVHDPLDPRPGHLPGARNLPCRENVDEHGHLMANDVLRRRLREAGVDGHSPVVSSCGSGVTACHTLLVMEHVGLGSGRLYPGSWSEYASDPDRPAALGER